MYHSVWRKFNEFVIKLDNIPKTWEEKTSLYCTYLIMSKKLQSSTVKSYISGIKAKLRTDGYDWNNKLAQFSSLLTTCRERNDLADDRLPIQQGLLQMILCEINRSLKEIHTIYNVILYRTIFLTLYYGLMRIGELVEGEHILKVTDVHEAANKNQYLLVLYSSKMHNVGTRPQKICIRKPQEAGNIYCPVDELNKYSNL